MGIGYPGSNISIFLLQKSNLKKIPGQRRGLIII